jgi:glycosyltransferase involved in cell wall biosynthesis
LDVSEGVLVEQDAVGFAMALRTCLTNAAERERLSRLARTIVERDYGWDEIGRKQRAMYDELVDHT